MVHVLYSVSLTHVPLHILHKHFIEKKKKKKKKTYAWSIFMMVCYLNLYCADELPSSSRLQPEICAVRLESPSLPKKCIESANESQQKVTSCSAEHA